MRWMNRAKLTMTVAMMAVTIGCVGGGSKGLSAEEKDKLKAYVLDAPPANIPHPIDVNFENKVHIIGYKFEPETAKPGAEVKLTYWWRCDDTLDDGWVLFTHLHDETSDKSDNLDWNGPIREQKNNRQVLGPDHWEKGKVYVDEQTYKMPDWLKGPDSHGPPRGLESAEAGRAAAHRLRSERRGQPRADRQDQDGAHRADDARAAHLDRRPAAQGKQARGGGQDRHRRQG